jgi:hypothetical protein
METRLPHGFPVKGFVVSHELLTRGFPAGGGPCRCTSTCCEGGVYADVRERDQILAQKERIAQEMDATQTRDDAVWFEDEIIHDADFPSGECVGTNVHNDKCVFLRADGRCSIQVASVRAGLHKWAWKPLFCILFPIEITDRIIGFDSMLQEQQPCCTVHEQFTIPLFEGAREELVHLLGEDGYRTVEEEFRRVRASSAGA